METAELLIEGAEALARARHANSAPTPSASPVSGSSAMRGRAATARSGGVAAAPACPSMALKRQPTPDGQGQDEQRAPWTLVVMRGLGGSAIVPPACGSGGIFGVLA